MYSRAKGGGRSQPTGGLVRRHRGHGGNKKRKVRPKGESLFFAGMTARSALAPRSPERSDCRGKPDKQENVRRTRDLSRAGALYSSSAVSADHSMSCNDNPWIKRLARSKKYNDEYRRNQQSGRSSGGISGILDTPGSEKRRRRSPNIVAAQRGAGPTTAGSGRSGFDQRRT